MLLSNPVVESQYLLPASPAAYFHALHTICRFTNERLWIYNPWIYERGGGNAKVTSCNQFRQTLMLYPSFCWKSFVANVRWQRRIPAQLTDILAENLGSPVSLLAQTAQARNVAAQTLQQRTQLEAQILIMETFLIYLVRQLFD